MDIILSQWLAIAKHVRYLGHVDIYLIKSVEGIESCKHRCYLTIALLPTPTKYDLPSQHNTQYAPYGTSTKIQNVSMNWNIMACFQD